MVEQNEGYHQIGDGYQDIGCIEPQRGALTDVGVPCLGLIRSDIQDVEETGQIDGGQLHDIRQGGAGLAAVVVLFLDENLGTGAIDRCAVAEVHVRTADANDDAGYKPGPVCEVLEKDFVEIEFFFRLISSYARIDVVLFGHCREYYW